MDPLGWDQLTVQVLPQSENPRPGGGRRGEAGLIFFLLR